MFELSHVLVTILLSTVAFGGAPESATSEQHDTKGTCYILHQSIVCDTVNVTHLETVREILDKASSEYPTYGFICNHCNLQGFPDELLQDRHVTTFGLVPHQLPPDHFPYLSLLRNINHKLTHLVLPGGSVTSSDLKELKGLDCTTGLTILDLRYSKLESIDSDTFAGWNLLEEVTLSGSSITTVGRHSFDGLDNLRKVDLSKNKIATLEEEAFAHLRSLTHLDLSSANISALPRNAFVDLPSLESLNLRFNLVSKLEEGTFNSQDLPSIKELQLAGLPFICECELQWFNAWLKEKSLLGTSGASCIFPRPFAKFLEMPDFCTEDSEEDDAKEDDDDADDEDGSDSDDEEWEMELDDDEFDDIFDKNFKQEL